MARKKESDKERISFIYQDIEGYRIVLQDKTMLQAFEIDEAIEYVEDELKLVREEQNENYHAKYLASETYVVSDICLKILFALGIIIVPGAIGKSIVILGGAAFWGISPKLAKMLSYSYDERKISLDEYLEKIELFKSSFKNSRERFLNRQAVTNTISSPNLDKKDIKSLRRMFKKKK